MLSSAETAVSLTILDGDEFACDRPVNLLPNIDCESQCAGLQGGHLSTLDRLSRDSSS
jgi:hypothetical protein